MSIDSYVAAVELVHIAGMGHVMLEKVVHHALVTVVHVLPHHLLHIVEMVPVTVEKVVRLVLEIVGLVLPHHLLHIVGMAPVTMVKIAEHVQVIVLERIHVITVHLQIGKHPLG